MRYRTATILSIVLIGGMFAVPAVILSVFLPSLKQGIPNPIPGYEQILLEVASFCLNWRFVSIPITVMVLFTVAAFGRPSTIRQQHSPRSLKSQSINPPVGITVIAFINILGGIAVGIALGRNEMLSAQRPEGGLAGVLAVGAILSIGSGFALLRLQNWARAIFIVLYGLSLIHALGRLAFAHSAADVLTELLSGSYVLWAIWYMHQQHVKSAFARL